MLALGVGNAWAESTDTYDFKTNGITKKSGPNAGNMTSSSEDVVFVSKTGNTTDSWTIEFTGDTYYGYGKNTGVQFGSKNYPPKGNLISKSYDNVSQVELITTTTSKDVNMSVNVGAVSFGEKKLTSGNSISQVFSGTPTTGAITVSLADSSKNNIKIEKIIITYGVSSGGGSDQDDCTAITPTLTYSSTPLLTNSTATATLEGNTGNGDVTYTTSDADVATVDANGNVTAKGGGTATITATIDAAGEYCGGTATAKITVTPLISCSEVYNLADDETFVLKEFEVTYVNGKYSYIKDDTGYGLIFNNAGAYGLKAGDQVEAAELAGKKDTYNGLVEIIPTSVFADLEIASGTAPAPEAMNVLPANADVNKYVKFEDVIFASTGFSSKKVTGKINAGDITFYDQFATNATFNTSKKYDVIGAVSIYNSTIQVNFISAEEVAEPTLNVKITDADFGKIAIDGKAERTLTLNGSLLTNAVSLAIEGEGAEHFKLASNSVTPTEGTITDAKIKITYKPTAEGTHTATLKITSDDVDGQTITLKGKAVQQHTVHFFVNGDEDETLKKTVLSGNTLEELPEATSCDLLNYPTFAGWTSAAIDGTTDVKPTMLDLSTPITSNCNYYAVFEKATVGGSSEEQTETITIANFKSSGDGDKRTCETNSATWTWLKNNASSTINVTYEEIRLYAKHTMTISPKAGCEISKIVVDINTGKPASDFADGGLSGANMSIDGNTATLIPTSGDIVITQTDQSRVNSFVVTYTTSTTTYEYITSCAVVVQTCEITYDFAGGESECTNDIVEEGAEYTLCSTAPTKAGHTFLNWKDQNGVEYAVGATINSVTEDLTLTAQWQVNSYEVTWMSLGSKLSSSSYVNYNTQPTQPTTNPTYLCGTDKEFVGWTTQEIEGVGTPANLYTDEFPVVTDAITYHAVFASKIEGGGSMSKAVSLTNGETVYLATESGIGVTGANTSTNKDATVSTTQGDWMPFTVVTNGLQYQFKTGDNYITAAAKSFKITNTPSDFAFENGYIVYNVPSGSDPGDYVLLYNSNSGSFYRFYKKSNIGKENYETFYVYKNPTHTDYVTSCEEVGSDMSNSTKVTPSVESGIFSVGEGKYVQFSTGNLQYEVGTNTWSFASEQYEVIGGAAYDGTNNTNFGMNVPGYTGKLDLFAWSADGKFGVNPSNADADYTDAFVDWCKLVDGENWYTLTASEMHYLLSRKKDEKKLWTTAELAGKVVLILLPDNWDTTTALEYGYVPATGNFEENVLDIDTWKTLEKKGAVLLPSGGSRTGGYGNKIGFDGETEETDDTRLDANGYYFHVNNVGDYGYYWLNTTTSSEDCVDCAAYLITPGFIENDPTKTEDDQYTSPQVPSREKRRGNSVRLVKKIPAYTITTTAEHGTVTGAGTYPQGAEVTLTADPALDYTFVNWTKGSEVVSTANPFIFEATENVELVANFAEISQTSTDLTGTFSVGLYEVAQFATGNLQHHTDGTWRFAKQQYQYVGEANINVGDDNFEGWIDMFGWSTNETNYGVDPRNVNEFYDGEFVDWGNIEELGDGWSTLSADQWKYLLNTRPNASSLKQIARVGSVVGIMLFPDVWNAPLTVTAQYDDYFEVNIHNYTLDQWTELEAAGALFLPAAGRRTGGYDNMINYDQVIEANPENLNGEYYRWQDNTNIYCYYWTSTINKETKDVSFLHNMVHLGGEDYTIGTGSIWGEKGRYGQSVRLAKVTDVTPETYTRTTTAGKFGTICLPFGSTNFTGAEFFECVSKEEGKVFIGSVTTLVAGTPYIFLATGTELAVYSDGTTAATPGDHNGLHGTFTNDTEVAVGNYILKDNALCQAVTTCWVNANRAYLVMSEVPAGKPQQMPGRRYIGMSVQGENEATGFENITNGENITIKTIENGQLIIIRNGEKFNAQGQRL